MYSFNETYHVSESWFIQKISSFFSLSVLCAVLFWNLGFFRIPNYVFIFNEVSSPFVYMATLYASSPGDEWRQLTYFPEFKNSPLNRLSIIWKSYLTDEMKRSFFQAAVTSILLYGCTTWALTKLLEKKLDGNYTRMLRAILNKSWRQHPTGHQLYSHLPPITKTIQVRRTRHAGHCWRSRNELIRDVLLWTPTHGRAKAGRPARTYIQQLCQDTGCCPEDLPRAMNDREEWRERVRDIRATSATWWWWWYIYIYACVCVCVCVFKMRRSTKSFEYFEFIDFVLTNVLYIFVFRTCCFVRVCAYIENEKELPVNSKPQNTPRHTLTHTEKKVKKLLVKLKITPTPIHTHTRMFAHTHTTINISKIKDG